MMLIRQATTEGVPKKLSFSKITQFKSMQINKWSKSLTNTSAGTLFGKVANLGTTLKGELFHSYFFKNFKHKYQSTQFSDHLPVD